MRIIENGRKNPLTLLRLDFSSVPGTSQ